MVNAKGEGGFPYSGAPFSSILNDSYHPLICPLKKKHFLKKVYWSIIADTDNIKSRKHHTCSLTVYDFRRLYRYNPYPTKLTSYLLNQRGCAEQGQGEVEENGQHYQVHPLSWLLIPTID